MYQLRYELCEFALLFLKSPLLNGLCSCCVSRFAESPTQRGRFTITISSGKSTTSSAPSASPSSDKALALATDGHGHRSSCGITDPERPTWRLGLLLIELTLGEHAQSVSFGPDGITATFPPRGPEPAAVVTTKMDDRTENLIRGKCPNLANAINFCLDLKLSHIATTTKNHDNNNNDEAFFRTFHDNVVLP